MLPVRHVFDFNQALMDFGATLCTARKPKCLLCPMRAAARRIRSIPTMSAEVPTAFRRIVVDGGGRSSATARSSCTRRPRGVHLEGFWEFPGGKCDDGESHAECLAREIREELDASIVRIDRRSSPCAHAYPDRVVELHFFDVRADDRAAGGAGAGNAVGPARGAGAARVPASRRRADRGSRNLGSGPR